MFIKEAKNIKPSDTYYYKDNLLGLKVQQVNYSRFQLISTIHNKKHP